MSSAAPVNIFNSKEQMATQGNKEGRFQQHGHFSRHHLHHPRFFIHASVAEFIDPDWGDKVNSGIGLLYRPARQTKFVDPNWGDKVNSGMGLSYRPARLHGLAGRYNNPMPEFALSPSHGSMNSATIVGSDKYLLLNRNLFEIFFFLEALIEQEFNTVTRAKKITVSYKGSIKRAGAPMDRRLPLSLSPTTKMRRNIKIMKTSFPVHYIHTFSIYDNKCTFILFFIQTVFLITIRPFIIKKFRKDSKEELKYEQN
jgi:hypothetical protein